MSDFRNDPSGEIMAFFIKYGLIIFSIIFGGMMKVFIDIKRNVLNRRQLIVSFILAIGIGFMVAMFCLWKSFDNYLISFIVPFSTLLSEKLIDFILANSDAIFKAGIKKTTGIELQDKKEDNEGL